MNTPEREALRLFRHQVYTLFGCRDALFEAIDAVLRALTIEKPAHLSLTPHCQLCSHHRYIVIRLTASHTTGEGGNEQPLNQQPKDRLHTSQCGEHVI